MAKAVTSKTCFRGGKLYREGDTLEYTGAKKDLPAWLKLVDNENEDKLSASEIVKLIKAVDSIEGLSDYEEYANDDRKTIAEAYAAKLEELTAE